MEVPIQIDFFLPGSELMELLQRDLSKIVPIKLQADEFVIRLQAFCQHLQAVIINIVLRHVQVNQSSVFADGLGNCLGPVVAGAVGGQN